MKKLLYIFATLMFALSAFSAQAQTSGNTYTLLEPLPCIDNVSDNTQCVTVDGVKLQTEIEFNTYLNYIFKFGIAIAGFLAVVMIIVGGFEYMLSEAPFAKTNGKDRMTNAIIGLLGVLTSYLILATIDPRLVQINSAIPPIVVNTDEALRFRQGLESELNIAKDSTRLEYVRLTNEISSTTKAIENLEKKAEIYPGLTEKEQLYLENLKGIKKEIMADRTKVLANEKLSSDFSSSITKIDAAKYDSFDEGLKDIAQNITQIENSFNSTKAQLTAANDLEAIEDFKFKKDFYIREMKEQVILSLALNTRKEVPKANWESALVKNKAELASMYDEGESTVNIRKHDDISFTYEALLKARIQIIESVIKNK